MGIIVHKGDNLDNGNYIEIFNFRMKTKYNNVFYIEDKQNADMLRLINQAYMLLFERSVPVSPSSPIITPASKKISQDNLEEISLSRPGTYNLQSPTDAVLSQSQFQYKQASFKYQVIKFMYNDRGNVKSQNFTFEELKNSKYLQKYTEDEIHFFIKHSKAFYEDDQGNVFYVKQETESD